VLAWAQRILADCDALEQELIGARKRLSGRIGIGVIPSALAMVARLTTSLVAAQPGLGVRLLSRSSIEIQRGLDDFELHAGITYLDNEPLTHVRSLPLYRERYVLLSARDPRTPGQESIGWAAAARLPLCLLVPEMQNRRIVDAAFAKAGVAPTPVVETDSIAALVTHVRESGLSAVVPDHLVGRLGLDAALHATPLGAPDLVHTVGLVVADRVPTPPFVAALWAAAQATAA
jgi:DNA-binding transcriptional LysR family regulator